MFNKKVFDLYGLYDLFTNFTFILKPNGNISATHECSVICGPIGCTVDFVCRLLHLKIILLKKPLQIVCATKPLVTYPKVN